MNLAGADGQRDARERHHRTEMLDEIAHLDQRGPNSSAERRAQPSRIDISVTPAHAAADGLLNRTAINSMPPRKTRNQSFGTHELDSLLDDAIDQGAEAGADDRTVAACQQAAADHRGNDRLEFLQEAAVGGGRAELEDLAGGEDGRAEGGQHEKRDLDPADRHADAARRISVAAGGEDPVAGFRLGEDDVADDGDHERPDDQHRDA